MATVVIIHAPEDTLPARALAEKLRQAQLTVVLEKPPGEDLRAAVKSAPVTIALWSPRSVGQSELIDEVSFARGKSKVVHAGMQSAPTPEPFQGDQVVNLTGWRGEDDFAPWRELASLVTARAGVAPLPPPAPRPPSGFFQPGAAAGAAPAPAPRAPQPAPRAQPAAAAPTPRAAPAGPSGEAVKSGPNMVVIGVVTFVAVVLLGGGGFYLLNQQQAGGGASWEAVDTDSPDALRAFLADAPGAYRDEAEAALAALEQRAFTAARNADTIEALQAFLADFPTSENALAARGRIAELRSLPQTPTETEAAPDPLASAEPLDPDLVPPGVTAPDTGPAPEGEGPATLTPPPLEEAPTPEPGAEETPTF